MTLPTGTITMGQVNTELGRSATATISLNETAVRTLAGVASGAISMNDLRGKSSASINFINQYIASGQSTPATAGYRVSSDGFDYENVQNVYSALTQWVTPTSVGGNYEVFATVNSGSLTTGTTGSWLATSSNPTWTRSNGAIGTIVFVNMTLQVRAIGTTTILDTWTIELEVERF